LKTKDIEKKTTRLVRTFHKAGLGKLFN